MNIQVQSLSFNLYHLLTSPSSLFRPLSFSPPPSLHSILPPESGHCLNLIKSFVFDSLFFSLPFSFCMHLCQTNFSRIYKLQYIIIMSIGGHITCPGPGRSYLNNINPDLQVQQAVPHIGVN